MAFITKGWAGGMQEIFTNANCFYEAWRKSNNTMLILHLALLM